MRLALFASLALVVPACSQASQCPTGYDQVGSFCVARDAGTEDAGSLAPDAQRADTGVDALFAPDASVDAFIAPSDAFSGCTQNTDCPSPMAAVCNASHACAPCVTNADCVHLAPLGVCHSGTCVQCSALDETACGASSCDPATSTCTTTPRRSRAQCQSCIADSECSGATDRCVPMTFMGVRRPGGFCLTIAPATGCSACEVTTQARVSLSGAAASAYCTAVPELVTTCEAVHDQRVYARCGTDADCGAPGLADGHCGSPSSTGACFAGCTDTCQCPTGFGYTCRSTGFCG